MRVSLLIPILAAACNNRPPPPFSYGLLNNEDGKSLLRVSFPDHETAIEEDNTYVVVVSQNGKTEELTLKVGFCQQFSCLGPITDEVLHLVLQPPHAEHIGQSYCAGLDGTLNIGIDATTTGDCADE